MRITSPSANPQRIIIYSHNFCMSLIANNTKPSLPIHAELFFSLESLSVCFLGAPCSPDVLVSVSEGLLCIETSYPTKAQEHGHLSVWRIQVMPCCWDRLSLQHFVAHPRRLSVKPSDGGIAMRTRVMKVLSYQFHWGTEGSGLDYSLGTLSALTDYTMVACGSPSFSQWQHAFGWHRDCHCCLWALEHNAASH